MNETFVLNETWLLTALLSLVGVLFGFLIALLAWIGNKVYNKLDEMSKSIMNIEKDVHERISHLDRRLVRIEAHLEKSDKFFQDPRR